MFLAVSALTLLGAPGLAQSPKPSFEVVSVKPQPNESTAVTVENVLGALPLLMPGGVFRGTHIRVIQLLTFAFNVKPYQIAGGPDWLATDAFQIEARTGNEVKMDQVRLMVQRVLEDRFGLAVRAESRSTSVVALVRGRPDGPLGPYIVSVDGRCDRAKEKEVKDQFSRTREAGTTNGVIGGSCGDIAQLADTLTSFWGTPVVDDTGLKGTFVYEMRMYFPPASVSAAMLNGGGLSAENVSILTDALKDQLGLRLESRRAPIETLVIQSITHPTPD